MISRNPKIMLYRTDEHQIRNRFIRKKEKQDMAKCGSGSKSKGGKKK